MGKDFRSRSYKLLQDESSRAICQNDTVCPMKVCILKIYEVKSSEFRNSKTTSNSKTFDFTYWGTFSTQNSEVYVQTNFFSVFKNGFTLWKFYLVKILKIQKILKIYLRIHRIWHFVTESVFKNFNFSKKSHLIRFWVKF